MRRKIGGERALEIVGLATIFFLCVPQPDALSQRLPQEIITLLEQLSEDSLSDESLVLYYENLARSHPNLNRMSREQLEETRLFSLFQIESILDYRSRNGDILSRTELSLVDGFNASKAALISEFLSFATDAAPADTAVRGGWRQDATLRAKTLWSGGGAGITGKYSASGEHLSLALTADSDAGEKLSYCYHPDFLSANVSWKWKNGTVVLGDYTVRCGQGLTLWKAFSLSGFGEPASALRRGSGVRAYNSTDEANFFRGLAATLTPGRLQLTAFISYNALDARVVGDTAYTSIVTGGYHRTPTEISKRRTMNELVLGVAASAEFDHTRIGVTAVMYGYDKKNARVVKEYNKYQMYDGLWGNLGMDFYHHSQRWRLFGEAAVDCHLAPAALFGAVWSPAYEWEISTLARAYSRSYIATHAGAYSTISSCSNQLGLTLAARYYLSNHWTVKSHAEYSYYPWLRFGTEGPTRAWRLRTEVDGTWDDGSSAVAQFRCDSGRIRLRLGGSWTASSWMTLAARIQGGPGGGAAYAESTFNLLKRKLTLSTRFTAYSTDGWDSRVCFYEKGVPQSFSVRNFYGKGTGEYLLLKYSPVKNLELWLKLADDYCTLFIRSFWPG